MVNLTRIYTRGGDAGETSLGDGRRVRKDHPRVAAYGAVDELNAILGRVAALPVRTEWRDWIARIQNDLFDLGADVSVPETPRPDVPDRGRSRLRVDAAQVRWLEERCDEVNAGLEPLRSFVLPGGSAEAAELHLARTVCRRAERALVALGGVEAVNEQALAYLNRLSDLLFILARAANPPGGERLWVPGAGR